MTEEEIFRQARIAIRGGKDPQAFLHLGRLCSQGIGTPVNHVLAAYFIEKAALLGSSRAEALIDAEYNLRMQNIVDYTVSLFSLDGPINPVKLKRVQRCLKVELQKGNYGIVCRLRQYISRIFPEWDKDKSQYDIVAGKKSFDVSLCYAIHGPHNDLDNMMPETEDFLQKLYAPIFAHKSVWEDSPGLSVFLTPHDENELLSECLPDFSASYRKVCQALHVKPLHLDLPAPMDGFPYLSPIVMQHVRNQAYRCVLSLSKYFPDIISRFLSCNDNDSDMLDICDEIESGKIPHTICSDDLHLFLVSYIEMGIDMDSIHLMYNSLYSHYQAGDGDKLANVLNDRFKSLSIVTFEDYPVYTSENMPLEPPEKSPDELPF